MPRLKIEESLPVGKQVVVNKFSGPTYRGLFD